MDWSEYGRFRIFSLVLFDFYIDKTYNDNIVHDIAETGENPVQVRYCTARYAGLEPGKEHLRHPDVLSISGFVRFLEIICADRTENQQMRNFLKIRCPCIERVNKTELPDGSFFCGKMKEQREIDRNEVPNFFDTTGIKNRYVVKENKKLRLGYTTGTCAAAAAKGAALVLLGLRKAETFTVRLTTPKGIVLDLEPEQIRCGAGWASCGIRKDAGDDPDVTDGILVFARVECRAEAGILIDGGEGVGRVTKKGLEQPPGSAAINRIPREMIAEEVKEVCQAAGYEGGILVTISVPGGRELAQKTFNPRLGIVGGISILGTSGIVEPMSEKALIKTIETEMRQQIANGRKYLLVTLGNYGNAYLQGLDALPLKESIRCSNYIGETIDMAVELEAKGILFIAHIGKFIKVAGGLMNTHSRNGDCRSEIMAACGMRAGISYEGALHILEAPTADQAIEIIDAEGLREKVMEEITKRIHFYLKKRAYDALQVEAMIFSNTYGYLGETKGCRQLIRFLTESIERTEEKDI